MLSLLHEKKENTVVRIKDILKNAME